MLVAAAGSAAIWLRVAWLQVLDGEHWEQVARRASERSVELEPRRGAILDADGKPLVEDKPVLELALVPGLWKERQRLRCEGCGTLHFRDPADTRRRRPRCCKTPSAELSVLGEGDLAPLEALLKLEPGELARQAAQRQKTIDGMVAGYELRLLEDDEDDFLVRDRVGVFRQNKESWPVVLVSEVEEDAARFVALDEAGVTHGLVLRPSHVRVAGEAGQLARVLGQASRPSSAEDLARARRAFPGEDIDFDTLLGGSGVEGRYDQQLRGWPGYEVRIRDDQRAFSEVVESRLPVPGRSVILSPSLAACEGAQRCLAALPDLEAFYAPRTRASGALIAMNALTGEILALAELPAWSPPAREPAWLPPRSGVEVLPLADLELGDWVPARHVPGGPLPEADRQRQLARSDGFARLLLPWRLRAAPRVAWDPPPAGFQHDLWRRSLALPAGDLLSRVSQVAVEPGSAMKIFIGLAMLESGLPLPVQGAFACDGVRGSPGCHRHGSVDFEEAIQNSCNQYFAYSLRNFNSHWPTYRVSVGKFIDRLGFGHRTGSDLEGETRGSWLKAGEWKPGESVAIPRDSGQMVAIGQGEVTATPLQMVRAVALFANGGRLVTPRLAARLEGADGTATVPDLPTLDLGLEPEHLARVREGMRRVIYQPDGTAYGKFDWGTIPARIYGKTGTAQVSPSWRPFQPGPATKDVTHQWFVGFAEAEGRPPLAFAVVYHARLEKAAGVTAARTAGAFLSWWYGR
jgi:cell division protein FtsI/penicillin-binding protein 2